MEEEQKQIAPGRAQQPRSREQRRKKPASAPSENTNQTVNQEPLSTTVQSSDQPASSENKPKKKMGGGKRYPKKSKDDSTGEGGGDKANKKLSAAAAPFVPKIAAAPATAIPAPVGTGVFCTICSDEVTFMAVGACNHPVCSVCSLRLRFKSKNDDCAICKAKLPVVVVYDCRQYPEDVRFTDLGITDTADDLFDGPPLPGTQVDASNRMLFLNCKEHYITLTSFKRINCPCVEVNCTYEAPSYTALIQHLNNAHGGVTMCSLCLDNRPLFMHEHELMTKKELQYHMAGSASHPECAFFRDGNPHKFTSGHPRCEFCKTALFDQLALYNHLQQKHFTCHLCDESMMFRYYQDLGCLRDHHKRHHFMCQLCDEDPSMSNSDVCYSFRTGEDYRDHLRSYHAVRDVTRYMHAVNKVNYHHRRQNDARRLEHYDLDVGSANPFSAQDGSASTSNQRRMPRGTVSQHRSGTSSAAGLVQDVIPTMDDFVPLIPPNMRVAGKISGTGRMMGLDDSDLAMQAMADAAYRQAAVRNQLHNPARVPSANAFPSLGGAISGPKGATSSPAVPTAATAVASSVNANNATKEAAKPAAHPLSLVNRIKAAPSTASQQLQQQRKQQQLDEDKRVARNVALAEALGIASKEQNNLTTEVVGATTSHQAYRAPIMEALAKYRLPATVLFTPLYPPEMITWAKKNHNELCKVERRLAALMADPKASSLALKPMKATDRLMMHCVAKYYHLHTYEYDPEPYRYVNVVKTVQSAVPEVLLSDACLASTTFSPYKLAPYVGKDPAAISAASTPTIYLQLDEGLIMTWGRSTDRKTQASVKPYAFNSSMVIFAEVILKLQELMMEYQQSVDAASAAAAAIGDDEHNVYEDFSLVSIAPAGPTALAIKFRDIPTAQMAERLLRDLQTRASTNATMVQNSTSVAMPISSGSGEVDVQIGIFPYYRVYPDFTPLPTPEAEEEAMAEAALAEAVMAANHAHHVGDTVDEDAMDEMAGDVIDSWSDDNSQQGHEDASAVTGGPVIAMAAEAIDGDDFHDEQDYEIVEAEAMVEPAVVTAAATSAAAASASAAASSADGDDWEQIADKDDFWRDFRASRRTADAPATAVPRYRPPTGGSGSASTSATAQSASAAPTQASSAPTTAPAGVATAPSSASTSIEKVAVAESMAFSAPDTSDDYALALALQQQEAEAAGSRGAAFLYSDGNDFPTELDLEALDVGAMDIGPSASSQARGPWQRIGKPTALAPSDNVVTAVAAEAYVPPPMRGSGGANNASAATATVAPLPTTTAFIVPTATAMTEDPALRLLRTAATGSSKSNKQSSSSASASAKQPKRNQFALLDDDDDDDEEEEGNDA